MPKAKKSRVPESARIAKIEPSFLCEELKGELGALFDCELHDEFVKVRTPFFYPDGDVIDLFYFSQNGVRTISDFGESTGWLRIQSFGGKRTPKQQRMIEDVCQTHGVEFFKGMLLLRISEARGVADAIIRVAQSALRVTDLWFTFRSRALESVTDDVAEFLFDKQIQFERREKLIGRSGKTWIVDFHTRTAHRSSFVQILTTGSSGAARGIVEHVLAGWYDLNFFKVGGEPIQFVSMFDDTSDVWSGEDFKLLDELSTISRWTRPDEFEQVLRSA